jgi:amidase
MNVVEYLAHDAIDLSRLVQDRGISAQEAVQAAIDRAAAVNPKINAVIHARYEEALSASSQSLPNGLFRGIPFLLKDLTVTVKGWPLTNGCRLFAENVSSEDSELAIRYRQAGAILMGRTTSPEFGLTTDTISALHGATLNPWDLTLSPGGSSGGAAAAVASGIVPVAQAGDGGGSIRIPAAFCGVFGLKPSRGRNPTGPSRAEGFAGMAVNHVVSRSVRDSAAMLDATAHLDIGAPYTAPAPNRPYLLDAAADPRPLRIGLQTESFTGVEVDSECVTAAESTAKLCSELGHEVVPCRLSIDLAEITAIYDVILCTLAGVTLYDRASELGVPLRVGDAEPATMLMANRALSMSSMDYARTLNVAHQLSRRVTRQLNDLDVILTPTTAVAREASGVVSLSNPDRRQFDTQIHRAVAFTQIFNICGLPAMSVPIHWSSTGMPIGVQFGGRYGDESTLFQLAGQLERARPWFHHYARCLSPSKGSG